MLLLVPAAFENIDLVLFDYADTTYPSSGVGEMGARHSGPNVTGHRFMSREAETRRSSSRTDGVQDRILLPDPIRVDMRPRWPLRLQGL
jgi:hypothetical protein